MSSLKRVAMAWNIQIPQMSFVSLFPFHRCGWSAMNKIESFKLKLAQFVFIFLREFFLPHSVEDANENIFAKCFAASERRMNIEVEFIIECITEDRGEKICRFLFPPREVESHLKRNVHCTSPNRMIKEAMNSVSFSSDIVKWKRDFSSTK